MGLVDWCIYYGDFSKFSNLDGSPKDAPGWNVQLIIQRDSRVGVRHISGDYYIKLIDLDWVAISKHALDEFLVHELDTIESIKMGRYIDSPTFRRVKFLAINDSNFPKKVSWEQDELR